METATIISFADREKNDELGPAAPANTCTGAEEFIDLCGDAPDSKPRLLIESCSPDRTVAALRDVLSKSGLLYERAVPIRLAYDAQQHCTIAQPITPDGLVLMAHEICRPYVEKRKPDGSVEEVNTRLQRYLAVMYLDWRGNWNLPLLHGIASTPLLSDDGTISSAQGYDPSSRMWIEVALAVLVPERPTLDDAAAALTLIRSIFATFCFADAETIRSARSEPELVDIQKPPGMDEFLFPRRLDDRRVPTEPGSGTGRLVARATPVGSGGRKGSSGTLHLHHRIWP